jgi:ubiquinone/menaquinone biosynthesis C-methylase UbiE
MIVAMQDEKTAASRWFDRRAGSYESGFTSRWRDPVQRGSLAALELTADDRVLDVGCGTGAASREAAVQAKSVVGVDLSPEMIRQAAELAHDIENVEFKIADSEQLPFDDGTFTAVICSNSFHHYPDPVRATREMVRVLASGGRLVLGDPCADIRAVRIADFFLRRFEPGHVRMYRSAELASFLYEAGLSKVRVRKLSEGGMAIFLGFAQ